jgi:hypothetical protein
MLLLFSERFPSRPPFKEIIVSCFRRTRPSETPLIITLFHRYIFPPLLLFSFTLFFSYVLAMDGGWGGIIPLLFPSKKSVPLFPLITPDQLLYS